MASSTTTGRCADRRGPGYLLERNDGKPFERRTIHRYVAAVAKRAGIGHVHPHQLRHTLATQAINRGMSLEAIAALLGHRSMDMTLVYARISDRTVADEYFKVTEAVEANYRRGGPLPAAVGGKHMTQASADHRRLLGNGHCTRPALLDCTFESMCERCGFFETGPQFVTILRRQRDHADERGPETSGPSSSTVSSMASQRSRECASHGTSAQVLRITCITPGVGHRGDRPVGA